MWSRSVVAVVCGSVIGSGAGCSADPNALVGTTSGDPASSGSTTHPEPGTTETTAVAESSTGVPGTSTTTGSTSEAQDDTLHIYFDVGGMKDSPPSSDESTGEPIDWDCDELTQPYVSETELVSPRGYHDVYFDADGHIIGFDGSSLVAVTYDDQVSVFLPGVNSAQAMDVLENGDLLYTNDYGELRMVTTDLQASTVSSSVSGAYGITVGPDQIAYVSTGYGIMRVDPESGETSTWLDMGDINPRAMVFNLDSTGVYISTLFGGNNSVYFQPVDDDLVPDGDLVVHADNVGQGYHDGLAIDACGNLYVPDYSTRGLYRVDPEGVVTTLYDTNSAGANHYGHGLEFGSGIDGWDDHAIYLPQPYDNYTVIEVVLGVPSGSRVRTWDN
jgi:hypothetical protein